MGIIGILVILGVAFALSNNRKAINYRLVGMGILFQVLLAVFILKTNIGVEIFKWVGDGITKVLDYSIQGGKFVFGPLANREVLSKGFGPENAFIFMFTILPTIVFVCVLVAIAYHVGLMQRVVSVIARGVHAIMPVSGAEALSNVASAFVGQVEAQIMIRPYLPGMTKSELLASMAGSMACIAGGIMAVYISMGVPASYLLAASIMAAPGALVIAKIIYPETEESETQGYVKLEVKQAHANLMDAIAHGCSDGMKISLNVIAMLIGVIALIALIDGILGSVGGWVGVENLSLKYILGYIFAGFAWVMGVPANEAITVGGLMGSKMVVNEFVAYSDLAPLIANKQLSEISIIIASFALCGFANFSSIAIQLGGIGEMIPERKSELAALGLKAMICGTLASYLSATLAGLLHSF